MHVGSACEVRTTFVSSEFGVRERPRMKGFLQTITHHTKIYEVLTKLELQSHFEVWSCNKVNIWTNLPVERTLTVVSDLI